MADFIVRLPANSSKKDPPPPVEDIDEEKLQEAIPENPAEF